MRSVAWVVAVFASASGTRGAEDGRDAAAVASLPSIIAFGSCAREALEQPVWDAIVAKNPRLFLFLGDNIYGDSRDPEVLRQKWERLGAKPGFARLRERCPILATWDDHDYGENDAGAEFPSKRESQRLFLEFFEEPDDSPRRSRDGVYGDWSWERDGRRLQVILLDTRFFRGPLVRVPADRREANFGPYGRNPDPSATMLGEAQWAWLESVLRQPADLRIIGSSIQVIPDEHGWEKWGNLPAERDRLLAMIAKNSANGVVFLSGDRHFAEVSVLPPSDGDGIGYPLIDVTSSGLNQGGGGRDNEPNRRRVGELFRRVNFGLITIDWMAEDPSVRIEVCDVDGKPVLTHRTSVGQLAPARPAATDGEAAKAGGPAE